MSDSTCSTDGCEKSIYGRSLCITHYTRWRRHGDPNGGKCKAPVPEVKCSVVGCNKRSHAQALCPMHYSRLREFGTLDAPKRPTATERFLAKVQKTDTCWLWQASKDGKGYGQMGMNTETGWRLFAAHRLSYEMFVGEIPAGYVVDHICHVVNCVRPDHLRPALHKENMEHRIGAASNSKTGVRGVTMKRGKYRATVGHNGRQYYAGLYPTIEEAEAAVIAKRNELHTHNLLDRQ